MRALAPVILALSLSGQCAAGSPADSAGVIRVFGDASSWMSACFVVGDGSWVVATSDAVMEKVGPQTTQLIRYPVFVSAFNGRAYQCEIRATNKDLNVALLKLPVKGLPASPLAQLPDLSKVAYRTTGELMSGDDVARPWPTDIYGVVREKQGEGHKLTIGRWIGKDALISDVSKYKWLFLSNLSPDRPVPDGSIVARENVIVGMYLNKLVITGGSKDIVFGRCAMSTEIARFLGDSGIDTGTLYDPPAAEIRREESADAAFQLQGLVYSAVGAGKPAAALEPAQALVKMREDDAQARMMLGLALTAAGKFEEALNAFDEAGKIDANLRYLRMNRALALLGTKKIEEAEAELLKAAQELPHDVKPASALADFYRADEKTLDKALTWAHKAVQLAPDSPAALLLEARVHKRKKDYQKAADTIGGALKMAPEWGDAWYALGATYEEAGDKTLAEKAYRTYAEKQPSNPDSLIVLASFLIDTGKNEDALTVLRQVRDLKPPKPVLDFVQELEDAAHGKKTEKKPEEKTEGT